MIETPLRFRPSTMGLHALALLISVVSLSPARANDKAPTGIPDPSIATSLPHNGDPGAHRARLAGVGITYQVNYTGEALGNSSGGVSRGTIYGGRLEGVFDVDLETLASLKGLSFHANAFQIHGQGLSGKHIGNFMTVSSIEALATTRLSELWLEQKLLAGSTSLRFGQLAADTEFMISSLAGQFINATFGWPAYMAENLPSGGPAYPMSAPGIRLKVEPAEGLTLLAAVFNGDPSGAGPDEDPQRVNRHGTNFRVRDPALVMGEAQFKYNQAKDAKGLAGTIKIGGWHHAGRFDDQRLDADGLSLADPAGSGQAARLRRDYGIYGVLDQQIWRPASGEPDRGVGVFARIAGSPGDRNPVDFYLDGGIVFSGLVPGRPEDSFGAALAYARISGPARGLDRDTVAFGTLQPIRAHEAALEINYKAQIVPGFVVIPDFQYIWNPGGHIAVDPAESPRAIKDAAVVGVRTVINY
jgi:porin